MQEIASMAFSPDGRLLAAQGAAPEWNMVLWIWEKSKVVTSVKTTNNAGNPVYQVGSKCMVARRTGTAFSFSSAV